MKTKNYMKKIKIRFINRGTDYLIQRKTLFGWKYLTYEDCTNWGCVTTLFCKDSKKELILWVLDSYYKTTIKFVQIIEYPEIRHISKIEQII